MTRKNRLFSVLFGMIFCFSLMTITAFAETNVIGEENAPSEDVSAEEVSGTEDSIPVTLSEDDEDGNIVAKGTCGDELDWILDDEGTLTISGTGPMRNWVGETKMSWYDYLTSIKKVVIENGVTTVGNFAFANCSNLKDVTLPESIVTIGNYSFYVTSGLTSIEIPNSVTNVGVYAFYKSALTDLTLPGSVETIGQCAFYNCNSLKSVNMSEGVESIGVSAFSSCTSLEEVSLAESITEIGQGAFTNCTSLTSIYIPSGNIGDHVFQNCTGLESISLGKGVTAIGTKLFFSCTKLQSLEVDSENPYFSSVDGIWFDKEQIKLIACPAAKEGTYQTPDTVVTIGEYAFYECKKLTNIVLGEAVETIQERAFNRCDRLESITLSDNLKTIEEYAFFDCCDLLSVTVPSSVEEMGKYSLGYYQRYEDDDTYGELLDGFKMYGYTNSFAEEYAEKNGIIFESIGIIERQMSDCNISLSKSEYTYDGKAKEPVVTVAFRDKTLVSGTDYEVSYSNNKNVGTAIVTITGKGNYTGTVNKNFTINKASQTLTAKAKKTSLVNGKTTTISASGKGAITYSSSNKKIATVSSSGKVTAKSPGKVTITVKAAGNNNYKSASKKIKIKVNPKATSIKSAKNSKSKKATVKWKKVSDVTGYQIQYSTSKSFKSKKSVTVKGATKVSKTLSKLKKGKTYYIRIRAYKTVSGTKYYSEWSSKKSVKIKK